MVNLLNIHFLHSIVIILLQIVTDGPFPGPLPIDGGMAFLLGAGTLYGIKKLNERTKSK